MRNWTGFVTIIACVFLVLISLISAIAWECEGRRHHNDDDEENGDDGDTNEDGSDDGDGSDHDNGSEQENDDGNEKGEAENDDASSNPYLVDRIHGHILGVGSEPVPDAKILIEGNGGHRVCYSRDDGSYSITFGRASPEPRLLKVTMDGYSTYEKEVVINGKTHLNVTLVQRGSESAHIVFEKAPWLLVFGIVTLVGGAAISKRKEGMAVSFLFSPLYTKLDRDRILDHGTRRDILTFIRENPGANYARMRKELGLQTSSTVHHVRVLEREGYIRSTKELGRRLFYPRGAGSGAGPIPFEGYASRPLSPIQQRIIGCLENGGPQTSSELASELALRRSSLHYSLRRLEERNLITGEKIGRITRYSTIGEGWNDA